LNFFDLSTVEAATDWRRNWRSYLASGCFHALLLVSLWGMHFALVRPAAEVALDAVDDPTEAVDERIVVEPTGTLTDIIPSNDTISTSSSSQGVAAIGGLGGGSPAAIGGDSSAGSGRTGGHGLRFELVSRIERASSTRLRPIHFSAHADELIAQDLGERVVQGETAAAVGNYGQALSRIAQEVIRLMREGPVLAVWLFDESGSMRDDQAAINADFQKVYEEIGLETSHVDAKKTGRTRRIEPLLSAVVGFGEDVHRISPHPTSDLKALKGAIGRLTVDESGRENTCAAIRACLGEYRGQARRQKRRLIVIVVTDESGDDWEHLEDLIASVREVHCPIYVLGREALFGYPIAHVKWVDPVYGLTHWLPISRGPETAMPECLQWDGLHDRWDAFSSGAGPYELARLASESGGIYFILPDNEHDLSGAGANEKRRLQYLELKQYQPDLGTREEYLQSRNASRLRSTIWDVISTLNPYRDQQLQIRELHYPLEPTAFNQVARVEFQKALRAMVLVNQAIQLLDEIHPLRAAEPSARWRADYDLLCAQCLAYRVRLFQFLLAVDQHSKMAPQPKSPTSNVWNVVRRKEMLPPDEQQVEATNVDLKQLNAQEKRARELFDAVVKEHAGTPWARRAEYELGMGFGMIFVDDFLDPRYREEGTTITLPKF
jgi:hypothetical protein